MSKNCSFLFLGLIVFLAFFLRFYQISANPPGLYWDEVSIGYNAYSILKTGKDEYGEFLPLTFKSFGDYKQPLYFYLTSLSIAIFGLNELAVRFPSAFFGGLTVLFIYFLTAELFPNNFLANAKAQKGQKRKNSNASPPRWPDGLLGGGEAKKKTIGRPPARCSLTIRDQGPACGSPPRWSEIKLGTPRRWLPLLASLLLAISPWHLHFSRAGFEVNLALFLIVFASLMFLRQRFFWATIFFFLAMFAYSATKIFIPVFLFTLILLYRKELSTQKPFNLALLFFILVAPVLLTFILPKSLARFYMVSALIGEELTRYPSIFIKNYLAHFSFDFLFFQGDQMPRHGLKTMGNLYYFEIPLILIGLWQLLKLKSRKTKAFLFSWLLIAPIASSLSKPSPHSLRSLNMIIPLVIISAFGLFHLGGGLFGKLKTTVRGVFKVYLYGFYLLSLAVLLYFFLSYLHLYWRHYPKKTALAWQTGNKEMAFEVSKREKDYDKIAISNFLGQPYLYVLFYQKIDPDYYQKQKNPEGFGKYLFVADDWVKKTDEKVLFVSSFDAEPREKLLEEIRLANGDLVYSLWELR